MPVLLNRDEFLGYAAGAGLHNKTAIAAAMGLTGSSVSRVLSGRSLPGNVFISGALSALPQCTFYDLFHNQSADQRVRTHH